MTLEELEQEMWKKILDHIKVTGWRCFSQQTSIEIGYKSGYQAGFRRGAEIMREEARKTALTRDTSYYDEDIKAEVLKHSISVDIKDIPLPEIGEKCPTPRS